MFSQHISPIIYQNAKFKVEGTNLKTSNLQTVTKREIKDGKLLAIRKPYSQYRVQHKHCAMCWSIKSPVYWAWKELLSITFSTGFLYTGKRLPSTV